MIPTPDHWSTVSEDPGSLGKSNAGIEFRLSSVSSVGWGSKNLLHHVAVFDMSSNETGTKNIFVLIYYIFDLKLIYSHSTV